MSDQSKPLMTSVDDEFIVPSGAETDTDDSSDEEDSDNEMIDGNNKLVPSTPQTRKRKEENRIKQTRRKNSYFVLLTQLLSYLFIIFVSFSEYALVTPLIGEVSSAMFPNNTPHGGNLTIITSFNEGDVENIESHKKSIKYVTDNLNKTAKKSKEFKESNHLEVLSTILPEKGEEFKDLADLAFSDYAKTGKLDPADLPSGYSSATKSLKEIYDISGPINKALSRIENTEGDKQIKESLKSMDEIGALAPYITSVVFHNNFPSDTPDIDFSDKFKEIITLTNNVIELLNNIFDSMIKMYQSYTFFYAGALKFIVSSIMKLNMKSPLEIEPIFNQLDVIKQFKEEPFAELFQTKTTTPAPKIKENMKKMEEKLETEFSNAITLYDNKNNREVTREMKKIESDKQEISKMLEKLQNVIDRFNEDETEHKNIENNIQKVNEMFDQITNLINELAESFETLKEGAKIDETNAKSIIKYKPLFHIEAGVGVTIQLLFSDFYKFLIHQLAYAFIMIKIFRNFGNTNKYAFPLPVATSLGLFPVIKKYLFPSRKGNKKKPKATRKKTQPKKSKDTHSKKSKDTRKKRQPKKSKAKAKDKKRKNRSTKTSQI